MSRDIRIGVGIDGEREFKQAVSDIGRESRLLSTELTAINAQYQDSAGSIEHLTAKQELYQRQQTQLTESIALYNRALQNAITTYGETSSQADNWRIRINQTQAALANCEHNINSSAQAMTELRQAAQRSETELHNVDGSAEDAADGLRQVDNAAEGTANSLEQAGQQGLTVGNIFKSQLFANLAADAIKKLASEAGAFIKQGIDLASDLQEVQNVVDVTFKNSSSDIYKWAEAAAESYGMSALNAEKFNGTMGAMLRSMGLTDAELVKMSTSLVGLSGDMASFYNLEVQEAFDKVRAGISGETEPLKQLGINMSVANLEAFALSEGITKAYKSMTQAEQATLRYNYILSATSDAQGDFARTSDSFANQQKILKLNLEDASAILGTALLPALNDLIQKINSELKTDELKQDIQNLANMLASLLKILVDVAKIAIENKGAVVGMLAAWGGITAITNAIPVVNNAIIAFNGLSASMGGISLAGVASAAGSLIGPFGGLALAVGGVVAVLDLCTTSEKELEQAATAASDSFKKQISILAECKSELEEYKDRQAELLNIQKEKGFLNTADQNELNNLSQKIELKELELQLEQDELETKQKEADLANIETMQNAARADSLANLQQQIADYKAGIIAIEETYATMQAAQKAGDTATAEVYQNNLLIMQEAQDELTQNIKYTTVAVNEFSSNISDSTEEGRAYKAELQNVNSELSELLNIAIATDSLAPTNAAYYALNNCVTNIIAAKDRMIAETEGLDDIALTNYEENLKQQMDDLEHNYKLRKLTEEEYYEEQKRLLSNNINTNSELYFEYDDKVTKHYDSISEASQRSAEKQQRENETAAKNAEAKAKDAFDKILKEYNKGIIDRQTFNSKYKSLLDSWGNNYKSTVQYTQEKITEIEEKEQEKRQKTLETAVEKQISSYNDQVKEIESKVNSFKSKNGKSFEDFFTVETDDLTKISKADFGYGGADMAISQETDTLVKYDRQMEKLRNKDGISQEILDQIAQMDTRKGIALANTLLNYSKKDLEDMSAAWEKYQTKLDSTAKAPYAEQLTAAEEDLKANLAFLAASALAELEASTGGATEIGKQMIRKLIEGLENESVTLKDTITKIMSETMGVEWNTKENISIDKQTTGTATEATQAWAIETAGKIIQIYQNNYSPKPLNALDSYTNTQKAAEAAANAGR